MRVQRSLLCSPTWRAPAWCDVKETPFHLVLERLKPAPEHHRDDAKKVMIDKDALCAEKGEPFADVRFVLMDLCSNDERRLELDALAKARGGAPGNKLADVVLQLTPVEFSRAWRSTRARVGTKRDATPAHEMSFEALADQYDDALVEANAVVGVEHYRQRKERLKAARASKSVRKRRTQVALSPSHLRGRRRGARRFHRRRERQDQPRRRRAKPPSSTTARRRSIAPSRLSIYSFIRER